MQQERRHRNTEEDRYPHEGQILDALDGIKAQISALSMKVQELESRLFIDNGRKSIQTRLCNLESAFKIFVTVIVIIGTAVATNCARKMIVQPTTINITDKHTVESENEK